VTADPRLLARFDSQGRQWRIIEGTYQVAIGAAADNLGLATETALQEALFGRLPNAAIERTTGTTRTFRGIVLLSYLLGVLRVASCGRRTSH
jgi:hypothetical protein